MNSRRTPSTRPLPENYFENAKFSQTIASLPGDLLSAQIIEILRQEEQLKATHIDARLSLTFGVEVSRATLYRRLEELLGQQVIFRYRGRFSLHPLWVDQYIRGALHLKTQRQSKHTPLVQLPLREGQTRRFSAASLLELDRIWNIIQLEVVSLSGGSFYRGYNSHAWHALTMQDSERSVIQSMIDRGKQITLTFGNDTQLDQAGVETLQLDGFRGSINTRLPLSKSSLALWVSNQFIVECEVPGILAHEFEKIFQCVKSAEAFEQNSFLKLFAQNEFCSLVVRKDSRKAMQLQELLKAK